MATYRGCCYLYIKNDNCEHCRLRDAKEVKKDDNDLETT
jgi:hypothetical protein